MNVTLLIDGYNLLHATGAVGDGRKPGQLASARNRLLSQIAQGLTPPQRAATQIVFDASRKTAGESEMVVSGMTVTFSVGFAEADDLLEQIIRRHPNPRLLTVISSDLRVQRCAKGRKAQWLTCDAWLMQLGDQCSDQSTGSKAQNAQDTNAQTAQDTNAKPSNPLSSAEVASWLREFGIPPP